jgi:hypothetical protein
MSRKGDVHATEQKFKVHILSLAHHLVLDQHEVLGERRGARPLGWENGPASVTIGYGCADGAQGLCTSYWSTAPKLPWLNYTQSMHCYAVLFSFYVTCCSKRCHRFFGLRDFFPCYNCWNYNTIHIMQHVGVQGPSPKVPKKIVQYSIVTADQETPATLCCQLSPH